MTGLGARISGAEAISQCCERLHHGLYEYAVEHGDEDYADIVKDHGLNPWEIEAARDGVSSDRSYFNRRSLLTDDEQRGWLVTMAVKQARS